MPANNVQCTCRRLGVIATLFDGRVNYPGRRFSCYQGKHGRDDYFALSRTARCLAARCYGCEPGYGL